MELNRKTLIFLVAIGMIAANDAQLTRDDKQYLLNEHNKIRRSRSVANMRLIVRIIVIDFSISAVFC
jgi:hypothetical protein